MHLLKPLGLILIFALPAMAADDGASAIKFQQFRFSAERSASRAIFQTTPIDNFYDNLAQFGRAKRVEASPAGVCFTMRSFKVKRTERFRDDEGVATKYSTCQMASEYSVRSTDVSNSK